VSVTAVVLGVGGAWWLAIAIQRPRRPLWVADSGNALAVIGQVIASCMAMAAWAVACAVIEAVNLMVRLVAFTLLWIWASLVVAARISWRAAVTAFRGVFDPVVSIFVPVATLLVTRLSPAFRF